MDPEPPKATSEDPEVDPEFQSHLCKLGRESLYEERDGISSRRKSLQQQTREMAFLHYPTFISGRP